VGRRLEDGVSEEKHAGRTGTARRVSVDRRQIQRKISSEVITGRKT